MKVLFISFGILVLSIIVFLWCALAVESEAQVAQEERED